MSSDVKWIKITTDIFDDEKILLIESMPEHDGIITIWFKLLCLAGKTNNSGVFLMNDRIAYTDEMLSTIFRRPLNSVRMALKVFSEFGMIEIVDGVITIPNWSKHQALDALEKKREYQKEWVKKKRERQKLLCKTKCQIDSGVDFDGTEEDKKVEVDSNKEPDKGKNERKNQNEPSTRNSSSSMSNEATEKRIKEFTESEELRVALREFVNFRKSAKKPMTEHAFTLFLKKLCNLGKTPDEQIEIINQSIISGWSSIYPVNKSNKNTNGNTYKVGNREFMGVSDESDKLPF